MEVVREGQRTRRAALVDVDGWGDEHLVVAVEPVDDLTSTERQQAEDLAVRGNEDQLESDAPIPYTLTEKGRLALQEAPRR